MIRAVILSVESARLPGHPDEIAYHHVDYKVLKRGRKRLSYAGVLARDEMDAFIIMQARLRRRGFKV